MKYELEKIAQHSKKASMVLMTVPTAIKDKALKAMASAILAESSRIIAENKKDVENAVQKGLSKALIDRLSLDDKRLREMADGIISIAALPDPVGETIESFAQANGLKINKVRVPLGVIAIIYEARPNVTADAAALCLKSGNCVILKGGSDAINSNLAICEALQKAAYANGIPEGAIEIVRTTERDSIKELLRLRGQIDCVIPRGGAGLINMVVENSLIPVIETGVGNCHAYVEASADLQMAREIVFNAKVQRPSVCNAIETLLVDKDIAQKFLPDMLKMLKDAGVEIRGDDAVREIDPTVKPADEEDWYAEYLDLILAVKVVSGIDEAIDHISKYGSHHSEVIITGDKERSDKFIANIDSAAVYVNASTRFTDGGQFGFGAEMGISTQKLHARGPMGLKELTSYKYVVIGNGQVRK